MVKRLLVLGSLLVFAASARAGVVVSLDQIANTSGHFDWIYDVTLENNSRMSTGDFFALYEIPGLLPNGITWNPNDGVDSGGQATNVPPLADWTIEQRAFGPVVPNLTPRDFGDPNVQITLSALNTTIEPRPQDVNGLLLGQLTLSSSIGIGRVINYTTKSAQGPDSNLFVIGRTAGPIPEPSTVGMMGAGLAAVLAVALRRRRSPR